MNLENILALMLASFLAKAIPGPGVLATVGRGLAQGFWPTFPFIIGVMFGDTVYIIGALFGLAALSREYDQLFILLRLFGGGYLIYLGVGLWFAQARALETQALKNTAVQSRGHLKTWLSGFLITVSNPKAIIFYLGLLPAFVDLGNLSNSDMILLLILLTADLVCILSIYAYASHRARRFFHSPIAMQRLNRGAGIIIALSGLAVISPS